MIVIQLVILAVGQYSVHVYKLMCLVPLFLFASFTMMLYVCSNVFGCLTHVCILLVH